MRQLGWLLPATIHIVCHGHVSARQALLDAHFSADLRPHARGRGSKDEEALHSSSIDHVRADTLNVEGTSQNDTVGQQPEARGKKLEAAGHEQHSGKNHRHRAGANEMNVEERSQNSSPEHGHAKGKGKPHNSNRDHRRKVWADGIRIEDALPNSSMPNGTTTTGGPTVTTSTGVPVVTEATSAISKLLSNNLGGLGPGKNTDPIHPGSMIFENVTRVSGISINMVVSNLTTYYTSGSRKNGVKNGNAYVNCMAGIPVVLDFSFFSAVTGIEALVDEFNLTIADLDMGSTVRETVTVFGADKYYATSTTMVRFSRAPDNLDNSSSGSSSQDGLKMSGSSLHDKENSPQRIDLLSRSQMDLAVGLVFKNVHSFKIIVNHELVEGNSSNMSMLQTEWWPGQSSRNLIFGTASPIFTEGTMNDPSAVAQQGSNTMPPHMPTMAEAKRRERELDQAEARASRGIDQKTYDGAGVRQSITVARAPSGAASGAGVAAGQTGANGATTIAQASSQAFQCASEWANGEANCPECTMRRSCNCDGGYVRFGYEPKWTNWTPTVGTVDCTASVFGDPYPGHGKLCMCIPASALRSPVATKSKHGAIWLPTTLVALTFLATYIARIIANLNNREHRGFHYLGPVEKSLDSTLPVVRTAPMICVVFVALALHVAEMPAPTQQLGALQIHDGMHGSAHLSAHVSEMSTMDATVTTAWSRFDFYGLRGTAAAIYVVAVTFIIQVVLRYHAERDIIRFEEEGPEVRPPRLCYFLYRVTVSIMYTLLLILVVRTLCLRNAFGDSPPMHVSIDCVCLLTSVFFMVHLVMLFLTGTTGSRSPFGFALAKLAALNLNFAPMICTLMLALQFALDSVGSRMKAGLETLMVCCTLLALLQALLAVISPMCFGADLQPTTQPNPHAGSALARLSDGEPGGDLILKRSWGVFFMTICRWIIMGVLLVFIIVMAHHLYLFKADPVSFGNMITVLSYVYFFVYVLLWFAMSCGRRKNATVEAEQRSLHALRFWHMCKNVVDVVCPLAAILRVSWWITSLS